MTQGIAEIDWEVECSRSGKAILKIGGRYMHSCYDPLREAQRVAEQTRKQIALQKANTLILVGLGLGYLPQILADELNIPILLWDPFPLMSGQVPVIQGDWQSRVRVVRDTSAFVSEIENLGRQDVNPHLLIHPGYEEFVRFESRFILWYLRNNLQCARQLSFDEAVISKRTLDVLGWLPYLSTIDELDGILAGQTVVLISPGPSHRLVRPFLLPYRHKGIFFAAIQSLKSLTDEGIYVDFAVAPDPQDVYFSDGHLKGFAPSFGALLADTSVDPALIEHWASQTFLFHLRTQHLHQIYWENCHLPIIDEPFISVSETMLFLAYRLGARRFILVGMDFSSEAPHYPIRFRAPNLAGGTCWTNSHYFHAVRYLNFLCNRLEKEGCRIWRVSDGSPHGLPIAGTELIAPQQIHSILSECSGFRCPRPKKQVQNERYAMAKTLLERVIAHSERDFNKQPLGATLEAPFPDFEAIDCRQYRPVCEAMLHEIERRRLSFGENPSPKLQR